MLPELVKVPVDEPVRCDHVHVDAWLVLLTCRAHQVRERVVQDCLCWDEWEVVQAFPEVARQRPRALARRCCWQQLVPQLAEDVVREKQQLLLEPSRV